ncbi:MAG: glycoside hydrolase family 32 protein [Anaerolineae bacterium]|nr:glycoside hydrolase family 32 protein [Anaerolineae bacterium]
MNDPNGLIQWQGEYHLFYQHNPNSALHADMHWGHAVSPDLIHWRHLPVALAPTPDGWDEGGCWSGCAVNHKGVPTLIYTGVRGEWASVQTQGIATSDDNLLTWKKYPGNPVIDQVPPEARQTRDFRDPFVWQEGDTWYMLLASRMDGIGGTLFLYRSSDLYHWEYMHPFLTGRMEKNGRTWECPNFFPLGDKWVLILSAHIDPNRTATVFYFVGEYKDHRFMPEVEGIYDYGVAYAPLTMQDDQGRRLLWAWLREGRPLEAQAVAGWSGVQSIPRELSLLPDNHLGMAPTPALEQLRGMHEQYANIELSTLAAARDLAPAGRALDIVAEFEPGTTGRFGMNVLVSPDGAEKTQIVYDAPTQRVIIVRAQSSLDTATDEFVHAAPHSLQPGEPLELRILVDGSVIEVIANHRTSITSRVYPSRLDSTGIQLFAEQSDGRLRSLDLWKMASIWPD